MALNPSPADKRLIAAWLTRLSGITNQRPENPIDAQTLSDYAEMLALDFPTGAFTSLSLRAVATGSEWFPAYDKIRREVDAWWNANRPACAPALTGPRDNALTAEDRRALDSFIRRHDGPDAGKQPSRGEALAMLHERFYGAWKELMRSPDNRAAYEDWINQGNPAVRLPWNHAAIAAAGAAEKDRVRTQLPVRRMDTHAMDGVGV